MKPGAAAVENLLRLARSESGAALAFAALGSGRNGPEVFSVPGADEHTLVTREALVELVRQATTDPELPHARALVRAVDVGAPLTLVVSAAPASPAAPLPPHGVVPQDEQRALIGLLFEAGYELDDARRELLALLADRLGHHALARRQVALLRQARPGGAAADIRTADIRTADIRTADIRTADIRTADIRTADVRTADVRTAEDGSGGGATVGAEDDAFGDEEHVLVQDIFGPDVEEGAEGRPEALRAGMERVGPVTVPAGVDGSLRPPVAGTSDCGPARRARGQGAKGQGAKGQGAKGQTLFDPVRSVPGEFDVTHGRAGGAAMDPWWLLQDVVTGLPSVARFLSQVGRLLAVQSPTASTLALVLVEVPGERTAPVAARALSAQLRNADPLARIDRDLFAAALLLSHGAARADAVEARLARTVRASLEWLSPVRTTHVAAGPGDRREVDELLRQAIAQLPGRAGAAEPPGGGRGAPLLGSPSPMVTS